MNLVCSVAAIFSIGIAAAVSSGCIDPHQTDPVTAVEPCSGYMFSLKSEKPVRGLDVVELSETGRIVDVLWRIRAEKTAERVRHVCYGVPPRGFRQLIPRSGLPGRLGAGNYLVRTRSFPIDEDASHYYQFGPEGEHLWRVEAGRGPGGVSEAEFAFRIDDDGRVVGNDRLPGPGSPGSATPDAASKR